MRSFEHLVTETNDYQLSIEEYIPEFGFLLYAPMEGSSRLKCVGAKDTLQACKELALEMYGAPMDEWRSEGGYFESLVAANNEGDTFRILEGRGDGFYLHAFDKNGENIDDDLGGFSDLQDTIQVCKEVALEIFGVLMDTWREEE